MYEDKAAIKAQTPEHIEKAQMFASFLINGFNPIEQNEAIKETMQLLREHRMNRIVDAKTEIELLIKSLDELTQF